MNPTTITAAPKGMAREAIVDMGPIARVRIRNIRINSHAKSTKAGTPLPSPTPRPTPTPARVHLPVTYRNSCLPGVAHADVVLLIDTSDSMTGAKLDQAKVAAKDFVRQLELPDDQAAVIGFNSGFQLAAPLTGQTSTLLAAIDRLASGRGTEHILLAAGVHP